MNFHGENTLNLNESALRAIIEEALIDQIGSDIRVKEMDFGYGRSGVTITFTSDPHPEQAIGCEVA